MSYYINGLVKNLADLYISQEESDPRDSAYLYDVEARIERLEAQYSQAVINAARAYADAMTDAMRAYYA